MAVFRKLPVEVEAVQFTGENWAELHQFTGHRYVEPNSQAPTDVFTPLGTYLLDYEHVNAKAELYVAAVEKILPIWVGDWVIKESKAGFYPCHDEDFQSTYISGEEYEAVTQVGKNAELEPLDILSEDSRVMGRVRLALVLTRPMVEVDIISERVLGWAKSARQRLEIGGEFFDEQTMFKVHYAIREYLSDALEREGALCRDEAKLATEIISALQNSGVKFREVM